MSLPVLTCPHCPGSSRVFSVHGLRVHMGRMHKNAARSGAVSQVSLVDTVNISTPGQGPAALSPAQSPLDGLAACKANIPVLRHIPKGARNQAAGKLCDIIDSCVTNNGVDEWSALLSFAYTALRVPAKELPGNMTSKVKSNIMSSVNSHDDELYVSRRSGSRSIKKIIETKVFEGDFRGAVRLLMSDDSFAPGDADTLASLKLKHPDPSRPLSFPPEPDPSITVLSVTVEDVLSALASFYSGSAAGLDGIRPGHLKELVSVSAGENGRRLVGCLTRLANFLPSGSPIFLSAVPEAITSRTQLLLSAQERLKDLSAHVAIILLRMCFALPKITYLMRTTPTWLCPEEVSSFDNALKLVVQSVLNVSLDGPQWRQAALPIRCGGLGVRCARDVGLPAFLASAHGVANLVTVLLGTNGDGGSMPFVSDAVSAWLSLSSNAAIPESKHVQRAWDDIGFTKVGGNENNLKGIAPSEPIPNIELA
ncbi:hypothetical protein PYW08_014889 [Mythimna loreyi]|uniref:Uncharacterized protein n=1 Tax=Mythimna loreyi TaxID=667449 RepID=A0ACC2R3U9_9NEOP|nr:hypothetical protein PYW08_014889 [Mythimna loreyi]